VGPGFHTDLGDEELVWSATARSFAHTTIRLGMSKPT